MPRIAHIALKVVDLDKAAEFYENVFGLSPVGKSRSEDRSRNRLSDGEIDLTFLKYDDDKSAMAQAAGDGPSIHHFAIEVDDLAKYVAGVRKFGCEIVTDPTKPPVKFRIPGGPLAEIVPVDRYQKGSAPRGRIVHLAMRVDDLAKCATDAEKYGCEAVTGQGRLFKFRAPGGIVVEPVPKGSKPGIGESE